MPAAPDFMIPGRAGRPPPTADASQVGEGEADELRLAQQIARVHGAQGHVPAVVGVVAVIPHDEDRPLRHRHGGEILIPGLLHGLVQIGLVQGFAVHIDGAGLVVDVHRLALHGDDPLDDGPPGGVKLLGEHHDVPRLGIGVADVPDQHHIPLVEGGQHGLPHHRGDAPHEGEYQNDGHQGHNQNLKPLVGLLSAAEGLFFFFRFFHMGKLPAFNKGGAVQQPLPCVSYFAYSMTLVSRIMLTLIWPGYSSSSSIFLAMSRARSTI